MAKDILGNIVKVGDVVTFNNLVCKVTKIEESRLLTGNQISKDRMQGIQLPGTIILEFETPFNSGQPLNMIVVKTPSNQELSPAATGQA